MNYHFNEDAGGRGPNKMDAEFLVQMRDGRAFRGRFIGVVAGVRKGLDKLYFMVDGEKVPVEYRHIAASMRATKIPKAAA